MKHGSLISPDEPSFSFGRATAGFDLRQADAPGDFVTIPDADLLFNGAFKRVGDDLSITGRDGAHFVVEDYFRTNKRATLLSPEGAALTPAVVEALAGPLAPGQYAQAGSAPSANPPIGRVDKVEGNASVVRNGVTIVLNTGDVVLKGDVVQTGAGASLGIVFSDGTAFSLAANARMVLNDFVYSAGASNNSALISLVQGSISFVAGQVAKTGDMRVDTPVATMGIRGTAVLVEINANNGQTKFSVMVEPNGTVGSFNLYDKGTGALLATVNNSTIGWVVTPVGPLQVLAQQVQKTPAELAQELVVIQQVFQIFDQGQQNPFDPSQPPQQQPPTDPSNRGDNTDPQNTQTAQGTQFIPSNDGVITVTVTQPAAGGGSGNSQSSNSSSSSSSGSTGTGTGTTSDTTTTDTDSASSVTYIFGTDGNDVLTGTANDDLLYAFGGDDIIIAGHGGGDDYYEGGSGFDEIRFTSTELGVEFHLNVTTVNGVKVSTATGVTETGSDTFVGIEKIVGGSGDDVFVLYDDADWKIDGREGFDIIRVAGDLDLTQESSDLYASNIELLDLDQNLSNLVRFTVGDIRTADSEMNALRVHADAGDAIELSDRYEVDGQLIEGEWRQSAQAVTFNDGYSDGRTFTQWEFVSRANDVPVTLATLYVQDTAPVSVVDGGHVFDFPLGEANQYGRRLVRTEADDGDGYFTSQGFGHYYPDVSVSDRDYHLGEDWNESGQSAADLGDPVFAIGHGTVVFSGDGGADWGNVVIIRHELADGEHGGFVTSLYGHLDALEVGVGDTVHRGQPIGAIGDHPGGPHLHLEIREGTNPDALIVGHGYSEQPRPAGWLDPSEFIASHQNAAGNRWTLSPQDSVVSEDDGFVTFTIARPLSDIAQTVFVSTVDTHGSANEQDYQYWYNVPVAFAPGESAREVTIRIIGDAISEGNETFGLIVQESPDDPVPENLASATFTIGDDGEGMSAGTSDFVATLLDQESAANPWISALSNGMNWTTYNSETTVIAYYLADDETLPDPSFSGQEIGFNAWSAAERSAIFRVMETYERVLNVKFVPAENMNDAQIIWGAADTSTWAVFDLYPASKGVTIAIQDGQTIPDPARADADQLAIVINQGIYGEDFSGLNAGGFNYRTMLHELGHALGLAHPHPDEISDDVYFPGVFESEETPGVFGYGDMALNQGIYTVMSYNRGWNTGPDGREPGTDPDNFDFGIEGTPMALDIATLQAIYGANENYNVGDNTYWLNDVADVGAHFSAIWDTDGNDTIAYGGSKDAFIDLKATTLGGFGAGGSVSFVFDDQGVWSGYTTAHGVRIENAVGGSGDDRIFENEYANILTGGNGADSFVFRFGSGHDTVTDFSGHWGQGDFIDLMFLPSIRSFGDFDIISVNDGLDTLLRFTENDTVLLSGVDIGLLNPQDFRFFPLGEM